MGTDGPADSMVERLRRSGPAPPPTGRRTSWIAAGLVIAAVVLVAAAVASDLTHDARLGPDPTVASSDSCGGGVPSAVLAFDARTGDQRWSALTGASSNLVMGDRTLVVDDGATFRGLAVDEDEARWCDVLDPTKVRGIRPIGSAGALLYVEADRLVLRADADGADGAERWSIPGGFEVVTSDDHVVLVADLERTTEHGECSGASMSRPARSAGPSSVPAGQGSRATRRGFDNPARTERFDAGDLVLAGAGDPTTGTVFVLVQAQEPYRD